LEPGVLLDQAVAILTLTALRFHRHLSARKGRNTQAQRPGAPEEQHLLELAQQNTLEEMEEQTQGLLILVVGVVVQQDHLEQARMAEMLLQPPAEAVVAAVQMAAQAPLEVTEHLQPAAMAAMELVEREAVQVLQPHQQQETALMAAAAAAHQPQAAAMVALVELQLFGLQRILGTAPHTQEQRQQVDLVEVEVDAARLVASPVKAHFTVPAPEEAIVAPQVLKASSSSAIRQS